jgi:sirohydrochlorin cobaltochelatase
MTSSSTRNAIVLFAHGSRDPLWHKPMEAVAERIRAQSAGVEVTCAYLELSQPDLPDTAAQLVANGVNHITIVPMFLGVGRHAREDLPEIVVQLKAQHPAVTFHLQPAVGEDARLLDMLAKIALSPA